MKNDATKVSGPPGNGFTVSSLLFDVVKVVGGIGVILGAFGFLTLYSHDVMLGVDVGLRDPLDYVGTGGLFLSNTVYLALVKHGFSSLVIASAIVFIVVLLSETILSGSKRLSTVMQVGALVGMIIIQILALRMMIEPLRFGGFLTTAIPDCDVYKLIVGDKQQELKQYYGSLAASVLIMVLTVLFWYWKSFTAPKKANYFSGLFRVGALLLTLISVYGLPLCFGAVRGDITYPSVITYNTQQGNDPFADNPQRQGIYLLYQQDQELIFYDKLTYRIVYVRRDIINAVSVGPSINILAGREISGRCYPKGA